MENKMIKNLKNILIIISLFFISCADTKIYTIEITYADGTIDTIQQSFVTPCLKGGCLCECHVDLDQSDYCSIKTMRILSSENH